MAAKSLRVRIKSLRVKYPVIPQEEIDDILRKLDGHDRELNAKATPKPVGWHQDRTWGVLTTHPHCPACEVDVDNVAFPSGKEKVSYCWNCGQAISWKEDVEDETI